MTIVIDHYLNKNMTINCSQMSKIMIRLMKVNETMSTVVESEDSVQHWERVLALADLMLRWLISYQATILTSRLKSF